jgi:NAD(P)-dependent dehydrogenase (short-subunit alcohol dehydrogenase family)
VINNAGIYGPPSQGLSTVDKALMLEVFSTNAVGPLLVVQQARKHGLLRRPALVANITSKVGVGGVGVQRRWAARGMRNGACGQGASRGTCRRSAAGAPAPRRPAPCHCPSRTPL